MLQYIPLVGVKELLKRVPYSRSHIYRLEQQGLFPKRFPLGGKRVVWLEADIDAWITSHAQKVGLTAIPSA